MKEISFKVSDLNSYFARIERDIEELKLTLSKIPGDRSYANPILISIQKEIDKLEEHRKTILDIDVKIPASSISLNEVKNPDVPEEIEISPREPSPKKPVPKRITKQATETVTPKKLKSQRRY